MVDDFYCDEVLSDHTPVRKVLETANVLAFHHTRPFWPLHIVVIPKRHIPSLLALTPQDDALLAEMFAVIRQVAAQVEQDYGECRVLTHVGRYQDSKHLHWHISSGQPLR
jgi:histidine triad (HIT) family protein